MAKIDKKELHSIFVGIQNSNELEFNKLYEKYKGLIYSIAFSILKNKEDSEEVMQGIFMKIFKLDKDKLPKENETCWLYTFTKNESINFLRKKKENIDVEDLYYVSDKEDKIEELIDIDSYNKIIGKLNKKEQEIVSLKILSGMTFKEISKVLGVPIGTVQWRYYKSLNTLKIILSNLSMFILTILIFFVQKKEGKKQAEGINEDITEKVPETVENTTQEGAEQKKEETSKDLEVNNSQDRVIGNETVENIVVETKKESEHLTKIDIGILSISFVFLTISIIFLINFVKNQQKARRKTSK